MDNLSKSVGGGAALSNVVPTDNTSASAIAPGAISVRLRNDAITVGELVDQYMLAYIGRDCSRGQRLRFWLAKLGNVRLVDLGEDDDRVHFALEDLAASSGRYFAGSDADGKPIFKSKKKPLSGASINRYAMALGAAFSWAIKRRVAPKGWQNPFKRIERRPEAAGVVRFLSNKEREALLYECGRARWKMLYALVLLAITSGARKGELLGLHWGDIDLTAATASLSRTKNNERRVLPLVPAVVEELHKHVGSPGALVFASKRRPDTSFNFSTGWNTALRDAGVKRFRFHDLRHSCASYLAQSGASLLEIADILGHKNLATTRRYAHLATTHKASLLCRVLGKIR